MLIASIHLSSQIALKQVRRDDSSPSAKRPPNDTLLAQATKRKISSRMDRLDSSLDECAALTEDTREEDRTNDGVKRLCDYASNLENSKPMEQIQASPSSFARPVLELAPLTASSQATPSGSSRLSLELPPVTPSVKSGSLPPDLSPEIPSPSYFNGSQEKSNGISEVVNSSSRRLSFSRISPPEDKTNGSSSSGLFGQTLPGFSAPFLHELAVQQMLYYNVLVQLVNKHDCLLHGLQLLAYPQVTGPCLGAKSLGNELIPLCCALANLEVKDAALNFFELLFSYYLYWDQIVS
ncbi:B-zip transcription factor [Quillaja saponaria]|uniref:B-zip transcription factor n=1 Tax=Quillaja saponaria TaxID=32244 RepID=A0AAD7KT84_QUISA|nr:B-zip transcription factor [Quillaja saponaria]